MDIYHGYVLVTPNSRTSGAKHMHMLGISHPHVTSPGLTIATGLDGSQGLNQSSASLARSPGKRPSIFPSGKGIRENAGSGTAAAILCICGA